MSEDGADDAGFPCQFPSIPRLPRPAALRPQPRPAQQLTQHLPRLAGGSETGNGVNNADYVITAMFVHHYCVFSAAAEYKNS